MDLDQKIDASNFIENLLPMAIIFRSCDKEFFFANKAVLQLFNLGNEELSEDKWLSYITPEEERKQLLYRWQTNIKMKMNFKVEFKYLKDGSEKWIQLQTIFVNNFSYILNIFIDITEIKLAQADLTQHLASTTNKEHDLETKLAKHKISYLNLVDNISRIINHMHDTINRTHASNELLLKDVKQLNSTIKPTIFSSIVNCQRNLRQDIEKLQHDIAMAHQMCKLSNPGHALKKEIFEPNEVISLAITMLKTSCHHFEIAKHNNNLMIVGDSNSFLQIVLCFLQNLSNYVDDYDENGFQIKLCVTKITKKRIHLELLFSYPQPLFQHTHLPERLVAISHRHHEFDLIFNTQLAITKKLISLMGGSLLIISNRVDGTKFIINLPFNRSAEQSDQQDDNILNFMYVIQQKGLPPQSPNMVSSEPVLEPAISDAKSFAFFTSENSSEEAVATPDNPTQRQVEENSAVQQQEMNRINQELFQHQQQLLNDQYQFNNQLLNQQNLDNNNLQKNQNLFIQQQLQTRRINHARLQIQNFMQRYRELLRNFNYFNNKNKFLLMAQNMSSQILKKKQLNAMYLKESKLNQDFGVKSNPTSKRK